MKDMTLTELIRYKDQLRKDKQKERNKRYRAKLKGNREARYKGIKYKATKDNKAFDIDYQRFTELMDSKCAYCGGIPTGLDRIDNTIGYTIDNTAPCCYVCNRMKNNHHVDVFKDHIGKIYNHLSSSARSLISSID